MGIENRINVSYLYHIVPMGIGTPYIESLPSYIKRLAEAHYLSTGNLFEKEILVELQNTYLKMKDFEESGNRHILSTFSEVLKNIIRVLEVKTLNRDLSCLTLIGWEEFFNSHFIFRHHHAWCPICYQESLIAKVPLYDQLIWTFEM